jgi:hypothetical protein
MSDEIMNDEVEDTVLDELTTLKARADMMGIKYHHNAGVEKLKTLINLKLEGKEGGDIKEDRTDYPKNTKVEVLTEEEFQKLSMKERKRNVGSLIRIRVTCMNPNKKSWEGEIISVGSAKLGTYKKFVPFNAEDGWHVPYIIYEALKERKCSIFTTSKDEKGRPVQKSKLIPEFSIEVLPPLTKKELEELARKQAMSGSIDKE